MSDPRNALGGAAFTGLVDITEQPPRGMITLKGDLASTKLKNVATGLAGVDFPGPLEGNCVGERGLLWMAPDELLLLAPYAEVQKDLGVIERTLKGTHHLAADVSDARSLFVIEGAEWRDVLAKLTPVDLHPDRCPPGRFRRTRIAQAPAAFWLRDSVSVELICFRSVAQYVYDVLCEAAKSDARVDYH